MADVGARTGSGGSPPAGVPGRRFSDVRHHVELDSTNRLVTALAADGAPEGVVVVADHQTAGRGRRGRRWFASPGTSLLTSILLRPCLPSEEVALVTLAVSMAAADACSDVAGWRPWLKWPNDLVAVDPGGDLAKLGGVLTELVPAGPAGPAVVAGLGLNLRAPPVGHWEPSGAWPPAAALEALAGTAVDRDALLEALLADLERRYSQLLAPAGAASLLADYRSVCITLGSAVRVVLGEDVLEGLAIDVTGQGHLVVEGAAGRRLVVAGDVVHVR